MSEVVTRQLESLKQIVFEKQSDWKTGEASVQWTDKENEVVCVVTQQYTFYWRGRVNYTNFSEDYQYHGERLLPPEHSDTSSQLTMYREPVAKAAQDIRQGDVVQSLSGRLAQVAVAEPMRVYQEVSMCSLQSGNHRQWQKWLFSHLLRLNFDVK